MLRIEKLSKSFNGRAVLSDLSLEVGHGAIVGLLGPNGAGKTTLLNILSGFMRPDEGQIFYKDVNIVHRSPREIALLGVARTFQDVRLLRQCSALENVLVMFRDQPGERIWNLLVHPRVCARRERQLRDEACGILKRVGILDSAMRLGEDLSYGQQKLVTVACSLATGADLVLLDEPVAGVDRGHREVILSLLREMRDAGKAVVVIEHDMNLIFQICDTVVFLDAGRKVCEGPPETVRRDPNVIRAYIK